MIPRILSMAHLVLERVKLGLGGWWHLFEAVQSLLEPGRQRLLVHPQRHGLAWVRDSPKGRFVQVV